MKKVMYLVMALMFTLISCKSDETDDVRDTHMTVEDSTEIVEDSNYVEGEIYTIEGEAVMYKDSTWYMQREEDSVLVEVELVDDEWIQVEELQD